MRLASQALAGVGFKPQHLAALLEQGTALDFFEVHAENYMVAGGPALRQLERLRERWPLSLHGVALGLGGAEPLCATHLDRLAALVARYQPRWVSEHLAWSSHGGECFNDLLPLPYNAATLQHTALHIEQTQARLGCRLLLENPSSYLEFDASTFSEAEFIAALIARSGCGLLLDLNNLYISAVNSGGDPQARLQDLLARLPAGVVGEIHLAGFAEQADAAGDRLLIDQHGAAVDAAVWQLYRQALEQLGPVPTLIERDNAVPAFAVLEAEALRARALQGALFECLELPP